MLIAFYAFFSKISDPRFGGTYMTLLNTVNTMGLIGPSTVALKLVDTLTYYSCPAEIPDDDTKKVKEVSTLENGFDH